MASGHKAVPPMPVLTHLTEEERNIIQSVIERQKACDAETHKLQRTLAREVETFQNKLEIKSKESPGNEPEKEANLCELCHKTKFADGVGKACKYCKRRVCSNCGDNASFPTKKQSSWVCVICKKKQELLLKTGGWFSPGNDPEEANPAETIESLLHDGAGRRHSLQENGPVRLNSSLGKSNSFDQHDRERGAFTPRSPRGAQGVRRLPVSPRTNPQSSNYSGYNGYGNTRTGFNASPRPSPRTHPLATRPSLSDDDVESPPGSEHGDFSRDSHVGATKATNKKVSFRDGHDEYRPTGLRGNRAENPGRDELLGSGAGSSIRWSKPDDDGKCLGVVQLKRNKQRSFQDNDPYSVYGLKVVGGKISDNDKPGAFVTDVDEGSSADVAGLIPGDEIVEWNEQSLVDCTFEDVLDAISNSQESPDLHVVVSRPKNKVPSQGQLTEDTSRVNMKSNNRLKPDINNQPFWQDSSMGPQSTGKENQSQALREQYNQASNHNISGRIQVKLHYDHEAANLTVTIVCAEGLSTRGDTNQLPSPYSKVYLLPDRSMQSKRRTKTMTKSASPRWSQSFVYPCRPQKFHGRSIEITVWDYKKSGESEFLGEVLIDMANASVDGSPAWYPLSAHDDSLSPLGPPTPTQPSSSGISKPNDGGDGPMILVNNDRGLSEQMARENAAKQYGDRPAQDDASVYSPRMSRTKHHQETQNSGRLSPSGSLISGRSSPGAKKSRTLPGVPSSNHPSEPPRRNSDGNLSNDRSQSSAMNIPTRASNASHQPYDQLSTSLPNGRGSHEPRPNMLRDMENSSGYLKIGKPHLKGELAGGPLSGRSSRSSSLASDRSPTGSVGSITGSITSTESSQSVLQGRKQIADQNLEDFVEGLGPAQMVGRQVLASPCMGDIQLSFYDRKGVFEVEVIRARGLLPKPGSKILPAPYVKVYLMENGKCLAKKKTRTARRTLEPLYQQQLEFRCEVTTKTLQVIVWGDYGRMDRKVFMGVVQILLSDLNLSSMTFGWYKLFSTASMCEPPIFTPPTSPMVSPSQGFTRQTSSSSIHSLPAPHRSRQPNMHKHSSLSQLGNTPSPRGQPRVSRPRIEMIEDEGDYV
ncbi:regulating synaptic membrane exocytosis protein 1-like isoform X2 [Dendronephthya gigantea]|uniref:regulating synaptic membrane exocytosis protein 1-like isoform X2 n=1 Tax=Dendronephthya gigantea TaxID=151771 RepID=UPI00106935A7|nr:regulating synaptic membrane exocytosis protein 1-like isoform X2 [Dendronephthya gigantea]